MKRTRSVALALASALALSGCGLQAERERLASEQAVSPMPTASHYLPGALGIPGAGAKGLGPEPSENPGSVTGGLSPSGSPGDASGGPSGSPDRTISDPVQKFLESVSLRQSDMQDGSQVRPIPNGTQVKGEVTLDLCGATFPSESLRASRRQVSVLTPTGQNAGVSTEAVLYRSKAAAEQAMNELIAARKSCTGPFKQDGATATAVFHPAPGPASTRLLDGASHAVIHMTETTGTDAFTVLAIYQRRDALLVGFYVNQTGAQPIAQPELDSAFIFATTLANRIRSAAADKIAGAPAA